MRIFKLILISTTIFFVSCSNEISNTELVKRQPKISPDYTDIVIPYNIAALNFKINESGTDYQVRFILKNDEPLIVDTSDGIVKIHADKWRSMLENAKGSQLRIEIYAKSLDGKWQEFEPIVNQISVDPIDSHLAYRLINAGYVLWNNMGIYQRNLENFDEKTILENKSFDSGCLNCHSFCNNDPNSMMIHLRAKHGGTIISQNGKLSKIDTKSDYTLNAGAYPCWHPDGKHIAFSTNNINQHFCNGDVRIEVSDEFSDIIVYDVENKTISTSPKVSTKNRENLPVWSPDGKFLYILSAPPATTIDNRIYCKYDLLRIGYNVNTKIWSNVDTVLLSSKTGKSISFPKISPDGKFLMFCMSDFGYFTIHHPSSDLYLLNLETGDYKKMNINSPHTDSYHCFSSTGRWVVFSSKRLDGLYTRPFFSHFDKNGNTSKPFVMPQNNPEFYDGFLKNYNIPELITGEVPVDEIDMRNAAMQEAMPAHIDASVYKTYMKTHLIN